MIKNKKRGIRRDHYMRIKRKRKSYNVAPIEDGVTDLTIETPKPCSCFMCGNPRKFFKESTIQEKKSILKLNDSY